MCFHPVGVFFAIRVDAGTPATEIAKRVREYLRISLEAQANWRTLTRRSSDGATRSKAVACLSSRKLSKMKRFPGFACSMNASRRLRAIFEGRFREGQSAVSTVDTASTDISLTSPNDSRSAERSRNCRSRPCFVALRVAICAIFRTPIPTRSNRGAWSNLFRHPDAAAELADREHARQ